MPTATEYRAAAGRFRALAEQIHREAGAQVSWAHPSYLGPGPVGEVLDGSLASVRSDLIAAGDDLERLATVCDQRAAVCAEYRREWVTYWELPPFERIRVPIPTRPARWADV